MWDVACHLLVHLKFVACSTLPSDVYKVEAIVFLSSRAEGYDCSRKYPMNLYFTRSFGVDLEFAYLSEFL